MEVSWADQMRVALWLGSIPFPKIFLDQKV